MPTCSVTDTDDTIDPTPILQYGKIHVSLHAIGQLSCVVFAFATTVVAGYLIFRHARNYHTPEEQRHIIRIVLMLPIYAIISLFSYLYYPWALYYTTVQDCYEAFALASFFFLLTQFLAPTLREQRLLFMSRGMKRKWVWPLGKWRWRPSGSVWFEMIRFGTMQYVFIRPAMTLVAVLTNVFGLYCESSYSPVFSHIWVLTIDSISVSIAMMAVIEFAYEMTEELKPYNPVGKLLCIKMIIFFVFWQTVALGFASSFGWIKATEYWSQTDIETGLSAILVCVEMFIFALFHLRAFTFKPYLITSAGNGEVRKTPIRPALIDSLNPMDFIRAVWDTTLWLIRICLRRPDPTGKRKSLREWDLVQIRGRGRPAPTTGGDNGRESLLEGTYVPPMVATEMRADSIPIMGWNNIDIELDERRTSTDGRSEDGSLDSHGVDKTDIVVRPDGSIAVRRERFPRRQVPPEDEEEEREEDDDSWSDIGGDSAVGPQTAHHEFSPSKIKETPKPNITVLERSMSHETTGTGVTPGLGVVYQIITNTTPPTYVGDRYPFPSE
ncbi:DUF300-domain-containing protein [Saitoella complicata NRRL Y-17804]|uniref:DUF300-domain-containing protein n=1 Tax=Saitoella complicata (strain BCRC 22490 / CBS 7301 / JCM 7358 / NBRC 10748 / NRRL Y-17804) TaxID=698492 RepID=UPI00086755B9|nr:DUF300-domain-containing protein [Saitoella complicata NRRL Y-17804]ODQ52260.1 DUF300-domain-containing protein [Saitoella complicata NRRL Y-17804]